MMQPAGLRNDKEAAALGGNRHWDSEPFDFEVSVEQKVRLYNLQHLLLHSLKSELNIKNFPNL